MPSKLHHPSSAEGHWTGFVCKEWAGATGSLPGLGGKRKRKRGRVSPAGHEVQVAGKSWGNKKDGEFRVWGRAVDCQIVGCGVRLLDVGAVAM